jgi:hypothetical protein
MLYNSYFYYKHVKHLYQINCSSGIKIKRIKAIIHRLYQKQSAIFNAQNRVSNLIYYVIYNLIPDEHVSIQRKKRLFRFANNKVYSHEYTLKYILFIINPRTKNYSRKNDSFYLKQLKFKRSLIVNFNFKYQDTYKHRYLRSKIFKTVDSFFDYLNLKLDVFLYRLGFFPTLNGSSYAFNQNQITINKSKNLNNLMIVRHGDLITFSNDLKNSINCYGKLNRIHYIKELLQFFATNKQSHFKKYKDISYLISRKLARNKYHFKPKFKFNYKLRKPHKIKSKYKSRYEYVNSNKYKVFKLERYLSIKILSRLWDFFNKKNFHTKRTKLKKQKIRKKYYYKKIRKLRLICKIILNKVYKTGKYKMYKRQLLRIKKKMLRFRSKYRRKFVPYYFTWMAIVSRLKMPRIIAYKNELEKQEGNIKMKQKVNSTLTSPDNMKSPIKNRNNSFKSARDLIDELYIQWQWKKVGIYKIFLIKDQLFNFKAIKKPQINKNFKETKKSKEIKNQSSFFNVSKKSMHKIIIKHFKMTNLLKNKHFFAVNSNRKRGYYSKIMRNYNIRNNGSYNLKLTNYMNYYYSRSINKKKIWELFSNLNFIKRNCNAYSIKLNYVANIGTLLYINPQVHPINSGISTPLNYIGLMYRKENFSILGGFRYYQTRY